MRRRRLALAAVVAGVLASAAFAVKVPPYEVFAYAADSTDDPPLNYMTIVEPGRTGEANASYVVLGISAPFPRTLPAVAASYDGDLVIPAYIDGLPVRKVIDAAFIECTKLRSVRFPATVREIGSRAFMDCYQLTNVTFEAGVTTLGDAVFTNCVALAEVRFPATLSCLGTGCFQGCIALSDVYFEGDAPRLKVPARAAFSVLGEAVFRQYGYYERFKVHINRNSCGWIAPYVRGVPEKWPIDCGYLIAHETVAEEGPAPVPAAGFVAVITEVRGGTVTVPETWTRQFPDYQRRFGRDFAASLKLPTGKVDAEGRAMVVWQDYVAGTDPTDPEDRFTATIELKGGKPEVSVRPELSEAERSKRKYTLWGKRRLADAAWQELDWTAATECNFFKVTVEMR